MEIVKLTRLILLLLVTASGAGVVLGVSWTEEEELDVLADFKPIAEEIVTETFMKQNMYLLRWLRAYGYDIDKTEKALKIAMAWRAENDLENIIYQNYSASVMAEYPYVLDGSVDRMGRPILQVPVGHFNLRRTTIARQEHVLVRYVTLMLEMVERYIYYARVVEKRGYPSQAVLIVDLQGYNLVSTGCWRCLGIIPDMVPILENYYPGMFHRIYFINTPGIFDAMLKLIKSLMRAETKESILIYDSEKNGWSTALLEEIPADQLQRRYGGLQPHPNPLIRQRLIRYVEMEREGELEVHIHEAHDQTDEVQVLHNADEVHHKETERPIEHNRFQDDDYSDLFDVDKKHQENHEPHHHYTDTEQQGNNHDHDTTHNNLPEPVVDSEKGQVHAHVIDTEPEPKEPAATETSKPRPTTEHSRSSWKSSNHSHNRTKQIYRDVRRPPKMSSSGWSNFSHPFPTALMGLGTIVSRMLCC